MLTPKQAKLFAFISRELEKHSYSTIITARDYDYTVATLRIYGANIFRVVGGYGDSPREKVAEDGRRIVELAETLPEFVAAIAYPNPVAARIAFGLGKPFIALTDSPHSVVASRLSLPLARAVVIPECVPINEMKKFLLPDTIVATYRGVDEVEWIKQMELPPSAKVIEELGLEPYRYIVARPPEIKAAYYKHGEEVMSLFVECLRIAVSRGLRVVYMPRYRNDPLLDIITKTVNAIVLPRDLGADTGPLLYYALAVVTGGATLAREAALMGTLGISLFPEKVFVDEFVLSLGLPLYHVRSSKDFEKLLNDAGSDPDRFRSIARSVLDELEKPSDKLLEVLKELC